MSLLTLLRRKGAGAPFAPTDIAGLTLWLKADTITGNDGDPVTTWADQSGNGNDATQATAAKKPTLQTAEVNGLSVVRFDTADDGLVTPAVDLSAITAVTVFLVAGAAPTGDFRVLLDHGPGTTPVLSIYRDNAGDNVHFNHQTSAQSCDWETTGTLAAGYAILAATFDLSLASEEIVGYFNGSTAGSYAQNNNNTDPYGNVPFNLGSRNNGTSFAGCDLCEVLVYTSKLSSANLNRVGNYLERWGTTWTDL